MNNKNIKELASFLQDEFIDEECSKLALRTYWDKKDIVEKQNPTYVKYLWNNLHDSSIRSIQRNGNDLSIRINDINANAFSKVLASKNKMIQLYDDCTVDFIFKNVTHFSINSVDDDGGIKEKKEIDFNNIDLLYDELIELSDKIVRLAFTVFKENEDNGEYLLILISAERLSIIEDQVSKMKNNFPLTYYKIIDAFENERNRFIYLGDESKCIDLINKYISIEK